MYCIVGNFQLVQIFSEFYILTYTHKSKSSEKEEVIDEVIMLAICVCVNTNKYHVEEIVLYIMLLYRMLTTSM